MSDLARRVAAQRDTVAPGERSPDTQRKTLEDEIKAMIPAFDKAMPRGHDAVQLARDALTCLRNTPKLAVCDPMTVFGGLMTAAQLGLRPAVMGQAWLLPMWSGRNKRMEATLIIGYQGLIELAYRSDRVTSIEARIRYEADYFDIRYGTSSGIEHIPARGKRGEATDYYSVIHLTGGGRPIFSSWTKDEVEEHRDKFAMARKDGEVVGPWRDHFDGMALKTTLLAALKTAPKSAELRRGMAVDGGVRIDVSPKADPVDATDTDVMDGDVVEEVESLDAATGAQ